MKTILVYTSKICSNDKSLIAVLFFLLSACPGVFAQQAVPLPYQQNMLVNYVRQWEATAPEQNPATLITRVVHDVKQTTQYVDGLGRPIQTVVKGGSLETSTAVNADMVTSVLYDAYGRNVYTYLPFVANNNASNPSINDGGFKLNPFQQQAAFYSDPNGILKSQSETWFYSQSDIEASPLDRLTKSYTAGNSWVGGSRGVGIQYYFNTATDAVEIWSVTDNTNTFGTYTATGIYGNGQLDKTITTDENGKQLIEFKDKEGKLILKKVQLTAASDNGTGSGYTGWLCTYYIYDGRNKLRCVIQPQGVNIISSGWVLTDPTILAEQCFRYEYDGRGRIIMKKVPGGGETWSVYDAHDREVMTQDANMRNAHKWMYSTYDTLNRLVSTGMLIDGTNYNNLIFHLNAAYSSTSYPILSGYPGYEELTTNFYDDYQWLSVYGNPFSSSNYNNTYDTYFQSASNTVWPYPQANAKSSHTKGIITGSRREIIGTGTYLYSMNIYDENGRVIQVESKNIAGGTDIVTTQYGWAGLPLLTIEKQEKPGSNSQTNIVLTQLTYDDLNRIVKTEHKASNTLLNGGTMPSSYTTLSQNEYNATGQLKTKKLAPAFNSGAGIEAQSFEYNIRGWLLGLNRNYIGGTTTNYFGMELGYDKTGSVAGTTSYTTPQYNGNIEGTVWKSRGDGVNRKYDFAYDNANRLTTASFLQNTSGGSWDNSYLDFTAGNLRYDANGNILSMNQKGFKINGSAFIDQLAYTYNTNSNKLQQVTDTANDNNSKLGDFKYNAAGKTSTDYSYDVNGNLTIDNNKAISAVAYNCLNLPQLITITGKGTVAYTYDAAGNKLQKITTDNTVVPAKITTTTYISGFIYQNDTLLSLGHEEGRARMAYHKYLNGSSGYNFEYDYFLKDHLGNTRLVLTQQKDSAQYIATMESAYRTTENALFYNIPQSSYPVSSVAGYPTDNTTSPNDSTARLNGSGQKTGPAILLKVMSGDVYDIATKSFYKSGGTANSPNASFTDVLTSLANGIVGMTAAGHGNLTDLTNSGTSQVYSGLNSFLSTNNPTPPSKPKAYLNWISLDEQFKAVTTYPQSGAIPIGNADVLNTLSYSGIPITKNGYLYIWVSNETPGWDVFFDNLAVKQYSGPILEETHYYPFGLTMAGISSKALKTNYAENKNRYNKGSELQNKEFSDGSGLEVYDTHFRRLDPQLGRWWQIDPKPDYAESPYASMDNNPISKNDPLGDEADGGDPKKKKPGVVSTFWKQAWQPYKEVAGSVKFLAQPKNWVAGAKTGAGMLMGTKAGMKAWSALGNGITNIASAPGKFVMNAPNMSKNQWAGALGYGFGLFTQSLIGGELASSGKVSEESKNLYRFDTRAPEEISAAGGFDSWGIDMNLADHASGKNIFDRTSGYVSTSKSAKGALNAAGGRSGYLYTLKNQPNGFDVNKLLGFESPFPNESEIAVPSHIPASDIKGVRKIGD